jgi:hypothetical protein
MAITREGAFLDLGLDVWLNDGAVDLTADTFKAAIFDDSATPDFTAAGVAYGAGQFISDNEAGPVAGGDTLSTPTLTISGDYLIWDFADLVMTQGDIVDGTGLFIYDTTVADRGICLLTFAEAVNLTNGILTVEFDAGGVWRQRFVPA